MVTCPNCGYTFFDIPHENLIDDFLEDHEYFPSYALEVVKKVLDDGLDVQDPKRKLWMVATGKSKEDFNNYVYAKLLMMEIETTIPKRLDISPGVRYNKKYSKTTSAVKSQNILRRST